MVLCLVFLYLSTFYVIECSHYTKASSYGQLVEKAINKRLKHVVNAFSDIYYVGHCAALIHISADSIDQIIFQSINYAPSPVGLKFGVSLLCFLLCVPHKTSFLQKVFSLSGLFIFVLVFIVLIYFAESFSSK